MLFEFDKDNSEVVVLFVAECADELSPRPDDSTIIGVAENCELRLAGQLGLYVGRGWDDAAKKRLMSVMDSRDAGDSAINVGFQYLRSQGYDRLDEMARLLSGVLEGIRPMILKLLEGV
jgi:hypothetical protein